MAWTSNTPGSAVSLISNCIFLNLQIKNVLFSNNITFIQYIQLYQYRLHSWHCDNICYKWLVCRGPISFNVLECEFDTKLYVNHWTYHRVYFYSLIGWQCANFKNNSFLMKLSCAVFQRFKMYFLWSVSSENTSGLPITKDNKRSNEVFISYFIYCSII